MKQSIYFLLVCCSVVSAFVIRTSFDGQTHTTVNPVYYCLPAFLLTIGLLFVLLLVINKQSLSVKNRTWLCLCIGITLFETQRLYMMSEPMLYALPATILAGFIGAVLIKLIHKAENHAGSRRH